MVMIAGFALLQTNQQFEVISLGTGAMLIRRQGARSGAIAIATAATTVRAASRSPAPFRVEVSPGLSSRWLI
jgi:hypothetical protein